MRDFKWTVVVALVVSLAGVADAYTWQGYWSGSVYDVYVTEHGNVGTVEDIWAKTITVVNKTGNPGYDPHTIIAAEELGYLGIVGLLHQDAMWPPLAPDGSPTLDSSYSWLDTHWLVSGPGGVGAWENVGMVPSAEPTNATGPFAGLAETSYGSRLAGSFTDIDPSRGASWDIAHVVHADPRLDMDLRIEGDLGGEDIKVYLAENLGGFSNLGTSGPYTIGPGQQVTLQAEEWTGIIPIGDYDLMWDLDGVGGFDDGVGVQITLDFNTAYALLGPGTHAIGVYGEVVDWPMDPLNNFYYSARDVAYTTLTIVPEPATFGLLAMGGLAALRRKRR